jgi:NAD(P)-dependent dehydrogenase (short-subunit alcohol dehydrogenase family)
MSSGMTLSIVTGGNRGIGLALVELLKKRGDTVIATCRKSSRELDALGVEVVEGVDVARPEAAQRIADHVGSRRVDLLINNAGILVWGDTLSELNFEGIQQQWEVNAVAPLRITAALRDRLGKGSKVAMITSRMGSIDDNGSGGHYGYRMSKAALNMAGKSLAVDLKPAGVAVVILHPGMVKTDMVGSHGQVEPLDAARGLLARIDELTLENTGSFLHANGQSLPW